MARTSSPRRTRGRILLAVIALLIVISGVFVASRMLPRFGIYLVPQSAQDFGNTALAQLDEGYYAHGDAWDAERAKLVDAIAHATKYSDLYEPLAAATKAAGGKHSLFLTPDEATAGDTSATEAFATPTVTSEGGITTIAIPELGTVPNDLQQKFAQTAADAIADAAPTTCGWVVDVRGNGGGNMYPMLSGVSALIPNGPAFSFAPRSGEALTVTMQDDGIGMGSTRVSVGKQAKITGQPIAVLQDQGTASSAEAVATAFRGLAGVESFGTPTAGYTSGNGIYPLSDGSRIILTENVYVDRTGTSLDEQPMAPDHAVAATDAPAAATEWIRTQGCAG